MGNNSIDHIEIEDFKCFENFKAKGFARVNLIGGQNNVGKTAFMEACFLSRAQTTQDLYKKLLELQTHRNVINNLLLTTDRRQDLQRLIMDNVPLSIYVEDKYHDELFDEGENEDDETYIEITDGLRGMVEVKKHSLSGVFHIYTRYRNLQIYNSNVHYPDTGIPTKYSYSELVNILDISLANTKYNYSLNFISPYSNSDKELVDIVGQFKLDNKYDTINDYLKNVFNVSAIDIIKNQPMLKIGNQYRDLATFGQGIKTFINIIGSILLLEDDIIFIDELENGIHYTHFDELWHIILTLSKQQNVQIFATTHSKECIESYAKIAKKLADKETTYIKMTRLKNGKIMAGVNDYDMLQYMIDDGHEVRGL